MKKLMFFATILVVIFAQSCSSSRGMNKSSSHEMNKLKKLEQNLVLVTDLLLKDLPWEKIQFYSSSDSVIFRKIQKGNAEVRDGIIFENSTLLNRVVIGPRTKGKSTDYKKNEFMIISFVKTNDTLYTFKPDANSLNKKGEFVYALCTDTKGTVKFNDEAFKLVTPGTFLYADKRTIPQKTITHLSTGSSVTGDGEKTKKKKDYEDY